MTKTDLVNYIAEEAGLTKADATRALDAFMGGVEKRWLKKARTDPQACGNCVFG